MPLARALRLVVVAGLASTVFSPLVQAAPVPAITRGLNQKSPTNALPVRFLVAFSEPVVGFEVEDVLVSRSAAVTAREVAPHDGTIYEVEISSVLEEGPLCISIPAGAVLGLDGSASLPSAGPDPCVVLDRTAPLPPVLVEPADSAATSDLSPRFAWAAPSDESGISKYKVEIRGPKTRDYTTTRTTYTPTLGEQGGYTWRVNCTDGAGNVSPWTPWRSLVLDNTPPESPVVVSSSPPTAIWTQEGTIDVAVAAATDSISGVAGYAVVWNNSASTVPAGPANRCGSWTHETLAAAGDGEWWFHAATVDRADNRSAVCHAGPFRIDRTPPTLLGIVDSVTLPNDPGHLYATANWSAITVLDALDPSPTVSFSIPDGTRLPLGRSDVVVTAQDHAGNMLTRCLQVWISNTEAPVIDVRWPEEPARFSLEEIWRPTWSVRSLAPIAVVQTKGVIDGCLDTQVPGRNELSVAVIDSTGLRTEASLSYVVSYADRHLEFRRIRADGLEDVAWPPPSGAPEGTITLRTSDSIGVRCQPDLPSRAVERRLPITYSLLRGTHWKTKPPVLETAGVLECEGDVYAIDIPLLGLRSGMYVLWIGFVDGFTHAFEFQLAR